ncbi:MAG: SDR family NAD(P)-dependent oxidoreductase, partial [Gammaproteobacteria bacterium]|nr:SDR family NAD(P)-dependent oxidoreductase [Gammaproteobacteria bacterium]
MSARGTRVFVTGATGFIGTHLVRRLYAEGAAISILVRPGSSPTALDDLLPSLQLIEGDLTDRAAIEGAVRAARPERVFHLGAFTNVSRDPQVAEEAMRVNLHGTMQLLQALEGGDLKCFVASGSCEEYGAAPAPFHEALAPAPVSPYSVSKAAATLWCLMRHRTAGLPVVVVRPFLVYGPGQDTSRLLPSAIVAALAGQDFPMTGGEQTREFTYVDDIVEGYLRAAAVPEAIGEIFNLGTGIEVPVRDVVEKIYALSGSSGRPLPGALPYRPAEIWRFAAVTDKARRILGWQHRT